MQIFKICNFVVCCPRIIRNSFVKIKLNVTEKKYNLTKRRQTTTDDRRRRLAKSTRPLHWQSLLITSLLSAYTRQYYTHYCQHQHHHHHHHHHHTSYEVHFTVSSSLRKCIRWLSRDFLGKFPASTHVTCRHVTVLLNTIDNKPVFVTFQLWKLIHINAKNLPFYNSM